jgi:amino acid transporter
MSHATEASTELRRNALSARHVVVMAMAGTGPASVIALNLAFMGTFSGKALVLSFILVMVVVLLLTNTFVEFSRRLPSAGSMFTWNTAAFGPNFGFLYGWFFAGAYLSLASAGFVVLGGWAESYFRDHLIRADIPWWVYTLLGIAYTAALAWLGVSRSLHSALLLLGFELLVMIVLGIWMVSSGGVDSFQSAPFDPSSSFGGWAGIGLAMTYGVLSVVGYEEAATLAEETRDSHRAVSRGLWIAGTAIPLFYILMSYAVVVGYGDIKKFSADSAALETLGTRYWGGGIGLAIVTIAVLSSILAFSQTAFNAGVRVVYALSRERLLPHRLAVTHPKHKTPAGAIAVWTLVVIAAGVPLGFITQPFDVWGYFGFMISVAFLIVYGLTNLALVRHIRRHSPEEFSPLRHALLPALAVVGVAYPLYRTVHPLPPSPYVYLPWVIVAWALAGGALLIYLRATRPDDVARVGRSLAMAEAVGVPDAEPAGELGI